MRAPTRAHGHVRVFTQGWRECTHRIHRVYGGRERERERVNDRASIGRGVPSNILRYTGRLSIHYQLSAFVARRYLDDIRRLLQTGSSRGDSRASFSINLWSLRKSYWWLQEEIQRFVYNRFIFPSSFYHFLAIVFSHLKREFFLKKFKQNDYQASNETMK